MQLFDDFCKSFNKELQRANFGFAYNRVHLFYRSQVRAVPRNYCPNTAVVIGAVTAQVVSYDIIRVLPSSSSENKYLHCSHYH